MANVLVAVRALGVPEVVIRATVRGELRAIVALLDGAGAATDLRRLLAIDSPVVGEAIRAVLKAGAGVIGVARRALGPACRVAGNVAFRADVRGRPWLRRIAPSLVTLRLSDADEAA